MDRETKQWIVDIKKEQNNLNQKSRKSKSYSDRYKERIEQLENEVKEKQEEVELTNNQATIDILEEDIYNTKQSIEELKKYA